jgi:type II secretory pathway pseudopilin PulG
MTLEEFYYIGQLISVVAILGTLIFVGLQVRQAKDQTEQANNLARAQLSATAWLGIGAFQDSWYATEESSIFFARALLTDEPLESNEKLRFSTRMITFISSIELTYSLRQQGLFDEELYVRSLKSLTAYAGYPRTQKWWNSVGRNNFIPPFQGVVDDTFRQAQPASDRKKTGIVEKDIT